MQDPQCHRQAVTESRKSDRIIKFITGEKFTPAIQSLMDNGDVWGAYFERSGALVVEDRDGRKHYNVLSDGSHQRPYYLVRWYVVQPMSGGETGGSWKSKQSAQDEKEQLRKGGDWVVMTARQWDKFKDAAQSFATEQEQRAAVSKIVGYDY